MAREGDIIDGKYEIQTLIGEGGMSKVYLAMDRHLNKLWAVKEIRKNAVYNPEVIAQSAIDEANMIKRLDHVALPRIVDILEEREVIYVIMDYIEGTSLMDELDERGAQPQDTVIYWAKQLCEVLDYLHTQNPPIIYRDLKPGNIMMKPDGNLKLIDFGIAREYKAGNARDTKALGTRGYAAPEQFSNNAQTDARTDIYALGVTLHQLLTGLDPTEPPYELLPIRQVNPSLSGGLEYIIQKCIMPNPEERYQSCAELLYALNHYEEAEESYRNRQKRKMWSFLGVMAAAVISLVVGMVGQVGKNQANEKDFGYQINQAKAASSPDVKADYYYRAKKIDDSKLQPYEDFMEYIKSDLTFDEEEETGFKRLEYPDKNQIKDRKKYANLTFEIGTMYWYYYDYGKESDNEDRQSGQVYWYYDVNGNASDGDGNQASDMKSNSKDGNDDLDDICVSGKVSAIDWFDRALDSGGLSDKKKESMAETYKAIGKFYQEIVQLKTEATDKEEYKKYWNNIRKLLKEVGKDESESEIVRLEIFRIAVYSIVSYARVLKDDGVKRDSQEKVLRQVRDLLGKMSATMDKTKRMEENVESRLESAEKAIENAYRNQGNGEERR